MNLSTLAYTSAALFVVGATVCAAAVGWLLHDRRVRPEVGTC